MIKLSIIDTITLILFSPLKCPLRYIQASCIKRAPVYNGFLFVLSIIERAYCIRRHLSIMDTFILSMDVCYRQVYCIRAPVYNGHFCSAHWMSIIDRFYYMRAPVYNGHTVFIVPWMSILSTGLLYEDTCL